MRASEDVFALADGAVWDAARRRLLWVDVLAGAVLEGVLRGCRVTVTGRQELGGTVGAVAVADDGTLLVAMQETLAVLRPDGTRKPGPRLIPVGHRRRLTDGGTDPAGRFLVGTLSLADPSDQEILARLEPDGGAVRLDGDLVLAGGPAWSTDGCSMYSVDGLRGTVFVRDYEPATGEVGERRVHLRLTDGLPGGIAVDAEDHLWIAVRGAGEIRRFDPGGALVHRLAVPAPQPSGLAFAGDDLRTLVITTARSGLSAEQLREHPASGCLFTVRVDVPGRPVPPWSGSAAF